MNNRPDQGLTKRMLADVKRLLAKRDRDDEKKFLVEGWKLVEEAVVSGAGCEMLLYDPARVTDHAQLVRWKKAFKESYAASPKEIDAISDTVTAQGIVAVIRQFDHASALPSLLQKKSLLIVALDGISDPGNLGTIIRTCDWFGVDAVMISRQSVDLYNPKVVRATMGSLFHLPVIAGAEITDLLRAAKGAGATIYSTSLSDSEDIRTIAFAAQCVIVIGSESHGVSPSAAAVADKRIIIPRFGAAESLNAAIACGAILAKVRL